MARLVLHLPPVPSSVPQSRHRVQDWLDAAGVEIDPSARDDVLVVVTELVTNGVLHDGGDTIAVSADADAQAVCIDVETVEGPGPRGERYRPVTDPGESGRGLAIVGALADDVRTEVRNGRRHVSCRIARQRRYEPRH
jgi:anti-sigma regulatory factor (Ser/Thr protein kinase)